MTDIVKKFPSYVMGIFVLLSFAAKSAFQSQLLVGYFNLLLGGSAVFNLVCIVIIYALIGFLIAKLLIMLLYRFAVKSIFRMSIAQRTGGYSMPISYSDFKMFASGYVVLYNLACSLLNIPMFLANYSYNLCSLFSLIFGIVVIALALIDMMKKYSKPYNKANIFISFGLPAVAFVLIMGVLL